MKPRRSLILRSDALGELTAEELSDVAGGAAHTSPPVYCVSHDVLHCAINDPNSIVCRVISDYVC